MTNIHDTWKMYIPKPYMAPEPVSIVHAYPFGQLVTTRDDLPFATSAPMYLQETPSGEMQLIGHMARHNPHAATLHSGQKALAIFHGPDTYVSASWYRDQRTVRTWNYIAAQVRGVLEPVDDDEDQLDIMRVTIAQSEAIGDGNAWKLEDAPEGKVETLLPHIRSFRISVTRIDAVTKLSQTQSVADQDRVISALEKRGSIQDREIARNMRAYRTDHQAQVRK